MSVRSSLGREKREIEAKAKEEEQKAKEDERRAKEEESRQELKKAARKSCDRIKGEKGEGRNAQGLLDSQARRGAARKKRSRKHGAFPPSRFSREGF